MNAEIIVLKPGQEYITLNVLLKITDIINTGGMAKAYLCENDVFVNGEPENRRGRKLYQDDKVEVSNRLFVIKKP